MTRILSADERPEVPASDLDPGPVGYAAVETYRPPEPEPSWLSRVPHETRLYVGWGAGAAAMIGVVVALLFIFVLNTHPVRVEVQGFTWERRTEIEVFRQVREGDWSHPADAYDISTSYRIHHYQDVYDHTESYQCGTTQNPRTCSRVVYRSEPVYRWYYEYTIDRWRTARWLVATADDQRPFWAALPASLDSTPILGHEREGNEHTQTYTVHTGKYELKVDLQRFLALHVGSQGTANVNRMDKVRSVNWDTEPTTTG